MVNGELGRCQPIYPNHTHRLSEACRPMAKIPIPVAALGVAAAAKGPALIATGR